MYETLWEDTKAIARWVWNWITVLAATLFGFLSFLPAALDVVIPNIGPLLPPDKAGAIIAAIGMLKGAAVLVQTIMASRDA